MHQSQSMLRLPEQAGDFSCLWTRKVYWQGMLWVQLQPTACGLRGHLGPHLSCWFRQLLWDGDESCGGLVWICAEETPSPQTFPTSKTCMAELTGACVLGDHPAGHPPCHDHRARDGRCPPLPAHAAAGQDSGGASPAPAAHPGDQHRVRGDNTSTRPGAQQPRRDGGREEAE